MTNDIDVRLRRIFAQLFPVDPAELEDDARRGELDGWDSLGHVDLVSELETQFSLRIDPEKALEIETFGDAKQVVAQLLEHA